tara:strand:- start:31 stop:405 length:375 start_codon:yes stop_codon:yes gene_type:complete
MNTTKAVYNKLFSKKTELETHKVELGAIQDLEKLQVESSKFYNKYVNEMDSAKAVLSSAIKIAQKSVEKNKEALKLRNNVEAIAKDIGMPLPKSVTQINPKVALEISEKDLKTMQSLFKQFKVR